MTKVKVTLHVGGLRGPGHEDSTTNNMQPTIKKGGKWKFVIATNKAKECLKTEELIWQTQAGRKELGSSVTKWWSKPERKGQRDMSIRFD